MESATLRNNGPDDRARSTTVEIPVRPEFVARARATVESAATRASLEPDRVDDLVVAVSEACTNAIEAQLRIGELSPIELTCAIDDEILEVRVSDRGAGFAPSDLRPRPPLHDPGHLEIERGWGIQLMRALVDELVFDLTEQGTCVLLRMSLSR